MSIEGSDLATLSDSTGAYRLVDIPPGPQVIRVRRIGFADLRVSLTFTPDEVSRGRNKRCVKSEATYLSADLSQRIRGETRRKDVASWGTIRGRGRRSPAGRCGRCRGVGSGGDARSDPGGAGEEVTELLGRVKSERRAAVGTRLRATGTGTGSRGVRPRVRGRSRSGGLGSGAWRNGSRAGAAVVSRAGRGRWAS